MEFNKEQLPSHIAIIMDGNRRWAKSKGKPVALGHREGRKNSKICKQNRIKIYNSICIFY
jgi:undecaprenyl diphosphate synthase